jgi:hypothetical protein
MSAAAALVTTLLFGGLMLPQAAEAREIRTGRGNKNISGELTEKGKRLEAEYAQQLETLQAEIRELAPTLTSEQYEALLDVLSAMASADNSLIRSQGRLRNFVDYEEAEANFERAQTVIEDAEKELALRHALMERARAMPDDYEDKEHWLKWTEKQIRNRERDLKRAPGQLEKARKAFEKAKQNKDQLPAEKKKLQDAVEAAEAELAQLRTAGMQHLGDAGLSDLLSNQNLDAMLAKFMVLRHGYWLAVYAQQGPEYERRIESLLNNTPLMLRMLVADGARFGQYGQAMEIYEKIRQTSPRATEEGIFERLALAVALEHAVPIAAGIAGQEAHGGPWDENTVWIDPVARYREYEQAWLDGELDPDFDQHDVWSLRMVVDVYQTGEYLAWGREMLRNYRPDLVTYPIDALRYSKAVDELIQYTLMYHKLGYYRDDLERMQNVLAVGGICGARAHFGGYILKAFGVPTTPRAQRGHAALVRYTPGGWVPYLGAGWGGGNREIRGYRSDSDFRASTEARQDPNAFMLVKRAQWIGKAVGEKHDLGWGYRDGKRWKRNKKKAKPPEPWNAVASIVQEGIIQRLDPQILNSVAEELGESDEPYDRHLPRREADDIPASEREITVNDKGVIHIPAAATTSPTKNTENIRYMPSNQGGYQLHVRRYGNGEHFEYTVHVPTAGTYALGGRVVTPAWDQYLDLTINGADEPIKIDLPYTKGMWGGIKPVRVELKQGKNVLKFSRLQFFHKGVSIRDFILVPEVTFSQLGY